MNRTVPEHNLLAGKAHPHALSGPEAEDWDGGGGGGTMPVLVYQTMPAMAHETPTNFLTVMVSPKKTMPLVTMNTVFKWPTTLYVRGEVAPMNRYVLQQDR
jgi:hypothetical protein